MADIMYDASSQCWTLQLEHSTYCFMLREKGTTLHHLYWGERIPTETASEMARASQSVMVPFESSTGVAREEYAPWGEMRFKEPGLKVEYSDGTRTVEWLFEAYGIEQSEKSEKSGASQTLWLRFRDQFYPFVITLYYRTYERSDVLERWVRLENLGGSGPISIEQAFSANWLLPRHERYRLTYLHGRWGKETQVTENMLSVGKMVLESRRGTTSHQFNPWLALDADGKTTEEHGAVWSVALAWSGSWKMVVETTPYGELHCTGGLNDFDFRYVLNEGMHLDLPAFVGLFSHEGFGGASRQWHRYEREHVFPEPLDAVRPVLYNSWEATSFAVNERNQMELAEQAAALGVEVFVMDDGWFGTRNNDRAGLGDWTVNPEKFPHGLNPLIARVNALGMRFGLWVEPEMVNADSDLYRKHPDWVYHFRHRSRTESRNQLVLNLARDDVRQWMFETFDSLLSQHNIEFIKWDLNRSFSEPGWPDEEGRNPGRVWLDHVRNLYQVLDELRRKHPNVAFETCSGGGGRVDLGILSRTEQAWTSDNTDAFDRLYIQEGFSYGYALRVMMCWVTDCPNYLTGRSVSLSYRFHVAMAGSLGIGGDLNQWTPQEREEASAFIATYKRLRSTIQNGLLYRLRSPRTGGVTASQYVAQDGNEVVVFAWGHSQQFGETHVVLALRGLEVDARYMDTTGGIEYSGAYLMRQGLIVKLVGDFDSHMMHLKRVK